MSSMSYTTQTRLIRGVIALTILLLSLHFVYSFYERSDYIGAFTGARRIQPHITQQHINREPIPRKIWQTGKNGPASLDDDSREAVKTWQKLNQNWRYEILTDYSAETYVRNTFGNTRPEIVDLYMDIRDPILRADMLRYLVLLGSGGVYSDMDTKCLKPIDDWIPHAYRANASVVVGIEYDVRDGLRHQDWTRNLQITNWAMLARPDHPMLERTVDLLRERMYAIADQKGTTVSRVELEALEVLDTTGPAMFTDAILGYVGHVTGTNFTWTNLTMLDEPLLIDDVLILPVTGFANEQQHSGSQKETEESALVRHLFRASWKGHRPADQAKEEEKKKKEEEEKKKKEEEEKKKKEEEEKKRLEEEKKKQEDEKRIQEQEEKKKQREAWQKQQLEESRRKLLEDQQNKALQEAQKIHDENERKEEEEERKLKAEQQAQTHGASEIRNGGNAQPGVL